MILIKQLIIWILVITSAFAQTDVDTTYRDNDIDSLTCLKILLKG